MVFVKTFDKWIATKAFINQWLKDQRLYCNNCGTYTLDEVCSKCKNKTVTKNPPRYSPQDHYGKYRRKLKKEQIR